MWELTAGCRRRARCKFSFSMCCLFFISNAQQFRLCKRTSLLMHNCCHSLFLCAFSHFFLDWTLPMMASLVLHSNFSSFPLLLFLPLLPLSFSSSSSSVALPFHPSVSVLLPWPCRNYPTDLLVQMLTDILQELSLRLVSQNAYRHIAGTISQIG